MTKKTTPPDRSTDFFRDWVTFEIEGRPLKARILNLGDVITLQDEFPEWQDDNFTSILATDGSVDIRLRTRFLKRVLELSLEGMNEGAPASSDLRFFHLGVFEQIQSILPQILGVTTAEESLLPELEQEKKENKST